ncbi:MAG: signal peptidase I [Clostridiaceae bacterium]|nr:signal peptidase I [Clostridiaceae bacterium]
MEKVASKKVYYDTVKTIVVTIIFLVLLEFFVLGVAVINGDSMNPTLNHADRLIYTKISYFINNIRRGDIVIFTPPGHVESHDLFIKRVVAIEGDTYFIVEDTLYINDIAVEEDYICSEIYQEKNYPYTEGKVPPNKVFVLGDKRNNSQDSRRFCCIGIDQITGKALLRIWPLNELRFFSMPDS